MHCGGTGPWRQWRETPSPPAPARLGPWRFTPQSIVPVYASLVRMPWTLVLPQSFPLGLAMPSSLRVLVMFYEPTALLKNMTAMLTGRQKERPEDLAIPGEQRHVCVDRKI